MSEDSILQERTLSPKLAMYNRCLALANGPESGAPEVIAPLGGSRGPSPGRHPLQALVS